MDALEIIVVLALLITIFIVFNKYKKCSSRSTKEAHISEPKTPELKKQSPEIKVVDQPVGNAEPTAADSQSADTMIATPPEPKLIVNTAASTKPQTKEPTEINSCLPQDSVLRRHYLAHLCSMIETLAPLRPTESVLCRHYDTMIVAKLDQCLNNDKAMAQLLDGYENRSIVNIEPTVKPETKEPTEINSCLPQDSVLRRHYLAHLCSMIETLAPLRPTESVLCRHYDTMIVAKLDQCLNNDKAMAQLLDGYQHLTFSAT